MIPAGRTKCAVITRCVPLGRIWRRTPRKPMCPTCTAPPCCTSACLTLYLVSVAYAPAIEVDPAGHFHVESGYVPFEWHHVGRVSLPVPFDHARPVPAPRSACRPPLWLSGLPSRAYGSPVTQVAVRPLSGC